MNIERGQRFLRGLLGLDLLQRGVDEAKVLAARAVLEARRARPPVRDLEQAELQVFSQFGDDGIIQHLIHQADVRRDTFVELGVSDYREANTRFLLVNDNWRGMVVDCGAAEVRTIEADAIHWRHDLVVVQAMVEPDGVNELLRARGFTGELGLLSIDIDGNDYFVWEALDVVEPTLVVVEYNALLGRERPLVVPYQRGFERGKAHFSHLYWGASLPALCHLAARKGYAFVGSNQAGNNAHFVRRDRLRDLPEVSCREGWRESRFRESRDERGRLSFLRGRERQAVLAGLPLLDVETGELLRVGEAGCEL